MVSENGGITVEQKVVEGTDESEIALEQAWLEFELVQQAKIRTGAVLVPLGRFNLNHDDNRWDIAPPSVNRPRRSGAARPGSMGRARSRIERRGSDWRARGPSAINSTS